MDDALLIARTARKTSRVIRWLRRVTNLTI
jgi:hypothetical protein